MQIEYHSQLIPEFVVYPNQKTYWRLVRPFEFSVDGERFSAPVDFRTDFASVPRLLWPILSPYDLGVGPIPHDLGYFAGFANKEYWDLVFLACMEKDNIPKWKREAAYRAVQWFGGSTWDRYRRANRRMEFCRGLDEWNKISNWGSRHYVRQDLESRDISSQQAAWLGNITVCTSFP